MDETTLRALLEQIREGRCDVDQALETLKSLPFADLGYAHVDHHRALRTGQPEVVFALGKHVDHLVGIVAELMDKEAAPVLVTRVSSEQVHALRKRWPELDHNPLGDTVVLRTSRHTPQNTGGTIAIVTAGTSDLHVAEEAAVTAALYGNQVQRIHDVGVAGLHRLLPHLPVLRAAHVVVVIAGMEGALASVVGGLVQRPVIAVPTSVGYGASFSGLAALLGMLTSCSSGITVVNIDNGFGAAYAANLIVQTHNA